MFTLTEKPERVAHDHYLLQIHSDADHSLPGQFIAIRTTGRHDPLLRRPFSIFDHKGRTVSIIVKLVGRGTGILANYAPGPIDCLGPLGTGFTLLGNAKVLIAGGGVGNAPLFYLARTLTESKCDVTYIFGTKTRDTVYLPREYKKYARKFIVSTEDGTEGKKGFATDAASELLASERYDMIYTCGPRGMMRKMVMIANGTPAEVSVENYFGCGIGLCSGCSMETAGGRRRACMDGPVFNGADINWESMPD